MKKKPNKPRNMIAVHTHFRGHYIKPSKAPYNRKKHKPPNKDHNEHGDLRRRWVSA